MQEPGGGRQRVGIGGREPPQHGLPGVEAQVGTVFVGVAAGQPAGDEFGSPVQVAVKVGREPVRHAIGIARPGQVPAQLVEPRFVGVVGAHLQQPPGQLTGLPEPHRVAQVVQQPARGDERDARADALAGAAEALGEFVGQPAAQVRVGGDHHVDTERIGPGATQPPSQLGGQGGGVGGAVHKQFGHRAHHPMVGR